MPQVPPHSSLFLGSASMSKPPAVETRLRPAMNVLWACGPTTPMRSVEAGFVALSQAVRRASALWPEFYFGEAVLRLVYDPAAPPASGVLATARRTGFEPAPYAGGDELRAAA